MTNTRWIIPEAKEPATGSRDAAHPGVGVRKTALRIGMLDNTKDNAQLLLRLVAERVRGELQAEFLHRRKGNATVGAPVEVLDELAGQTDCVLTAMAD
jgi:hypothetical protein